MIWSLRRIPREQTGHSTGLVLMSFSQGTCRTFPAGPSLRRGDDPKGPVVLGRTPRKNATANSPAAPASPSRYQDIPDIGILRIGGSRLLRKSSYHFQNRADIQTTRKTVARLVPCCIRLTI